MYAITYSGMDTIKVIVFSVIDEGHRLEKYMYIYILFLIFMGKKVTL
jgi:hypothetical protein